MNEQIADHRFGLGGAALHARASGSLWWPAERLLCVSDLHLGKADRIARRSGAMLPPYEVAETLARLDAEIAALDPARVVALGDSFDDFIAARSLAGDLRMRIARMASGRDWVWIAGNHDPAPCGLPGIGVAGFTHGPLVFRHIAAPDARAEISGHYHPKARLGLGGGSVSRPCFLVDGRRVVMPAFGTYTGGLETASPVLAALMEDGAVAILTGRRALAVPMPRDPAPKAMPFRAMHRRRG